MATLNIWTNFSKRKNSTKQPTGGIPIDVKLKENTSIESPVFICNNVGNVNYCQYAGNYYFVEDVIYRTNNIVELVCSMDAMATNKSAIASYNCFVERASSNYDLMLRDTAISQKQTISFASGTEQTIPHIDTDMGIYIVRILGRTGITGKVFSKTSLDNLMNFANDFGNFNNVFQGLDPIVDGAVMGVFNPNKFIVSCKWFPLNIDCMDVSTAVTVWLGNWNTGQNAPSIRSPKVTINTTIALPTPIYPNDFRKYDSSWTKINCYLPCIGTVELDPARYPNGIGVKYIADLYTGALTVLLADADSNVPVNQFTGVIGIDMPIGKESINMSAIGGALSVGGAKNFLSNPLDSISSMMSDTPTMIGGQGTVAVIQTMDKIRVGLSAFNTADIPNTLGRPLMKNVTLGSLSGYVKCNNASLDSVAYGKEKDIINGYLNGGFYME